MKSIITTILVGLVSGSLLAQTADQDVTNGLNYLAAEDLVHANQQFTNALALSPTHASANALVAATRLLLLPTTPAGSNFLNSLGYPKAGRNIYNWTSSLPVDINGKTLLPTNNTSMMVAFGRTNILNALMASRTNLAMITDPTFTLSLTAGETTMQAVTLDYGDILLLQAMERAAEFAVYTANAQNANVVMRQIQTLADTNGLSFQKLLSLYPSLLTLANTNDLAPSKAALTNAIALYFAASDFIRNVRAPGAPALFTLENDETNTEALFRTGLTNFLASLNGPAQFDAPDPVTINSSVYFAGTKTLRSLLPQFNGDSYVQNTLPDYSFGGILVNEPAYLVEKQLRHMLPTYAGIYLGHVDDSTFGDSDAGIFAVFLGTNQQATVVGFDVDSAQNYQSGQSGGVSAQFSVDAHGNWQFNSNTVAGVAGSGSFSKDGSFDGELDFTNGDSVWLHGYGQSALQSLSPDCYQCHSPGDFASRSFQNQAGNYTGTWSGTFNSQAESGTVNSILAVGGQFALCAFNHGTENDGAEGQLGANNVFTTTSADGTTISGTLTNATFKIGGTSINQWGSAKWTATRSATIPFDTPPVITKNLPLTLAASAGTNLTISLTATGSPPMCFQWYSNGVAIPLATTNALLLSNLPLSSAAIYSVTIDNVAGETNSAQLSLTVVPEPILTVQMTGRGTISPNYSNALLQIGTTYTMTAAVVTNSGFRFTNWTGGTSLPLAVLTNGATLKFTMVSNLVLQANFVDTNRPTLTIAAPTAGQHMTNALAFVTGTAADNWKVTGVWCQLNSNSWALATSTNGWTNWTTVFKLAAGTNAIRAYAADLGGNLSLTNSVSVLSSNAFKLLLNLTSGQPLPANGLVFNLQLSPGLNGHIQVSTNLEDWTVLTNFVGTNAAASFRDPSATNGTRFYRAVVP